MKRPPPLAKVTGRSFLRMRLKPREREGGGGGSGIFCGGLWFLGAGMDFVERPLLGGRGRRVWIYDTVDTTTPPSFRRVCHRHVMILLFLDAGGEGAGGWGL